MSNLNRFQRDKIIIEYFQDSRLQTVHRVILLYLSYQYEVSENKLDDGYFHIPLKQFQIELNLSTGYIKAKIDELKEIGMIDYRLVPINPKNNDIKAIFYKLIV